MDSRDTPAEPTRDGECAACQEPVPADRIRVLAQRDELVFAELPCQACGSLSLAILLPARPPADSDTAPASRPVDASDVAAVRDFLAGWSGDLRTLVDPARRPDGSQRSA
jgi:hypothetical protein